MESRIKIIATPRQMNAACNRSKNFSVKYYERVYKYEDGTCEYDCIIRHKELDKPLGVFTLNEIKELLS